MDGFVYFGYGEGLVVGFDICMVVIFECIEVFGRVGVGFGGVGDFKDVGFVV